MKCGDADAILFWSYPGPHSISPPGEADAPAYADVRRLPPQPPAPGPRLRARAPSPRPHHTHTRMSFSSGSLCFVFGGAQLFPGVVPGLPQGLPPNGGGGLHSSSYQDKHISCVVRVLTCVLAARADPRQSQRLSSVPAARSRILDTKPPSTRSRAPRPPAPPPPNRTRITAWYPC